MPYVIIGLHHCRSQNEILESSPPGDNHADFQQTFRLLEFWKGGDDSNILV